MTVFWVLAIGSAALFVFALACAASMDRDEQRRRRQIEAEQSNHDRFDAHLKEKQT